MRRYPWLVVSVLGLLGVLVLGAFPTRAYLDQQQERERLETQASTLRAENQTLSARAAELETDATIERLARERYQLVRPGEEAYVILPDGRPPPADPTPVVARPDPAAGWWSRTWAKITSVL